MDMPYTQFQAWRAYYRISPFGTFRTDLNSGIVASTMANIHRAKGKPPFKPADFMPYLEKQNATQTTSDDIERRITEFMSNF